MLYLSIDGRKEVHDRMRPFRGGQGSYDLIVPKFQKVAESRNQTNYYVRGTFTHNNLDFCRGRASPCGFGLQADIRRAGSGAARRMITQFRKKILPKLL